MYGNTSAQFETSANSSPVWKPLNSYKSRSQRHNLMLLDGVTLDLLTSVRNGYEMFLKFLE